MIILGLSAYYHDSASALVVDGDIIAAAQEERFTRKKHNLSFPENAIAYCLHEAGVELTAVNYVVFYDKSLVKFDRLLETYLAYAPRGFNSFIAAMPIWLKEKLFLKCTLKKELMAFSPLEEKQLPTLLFTEHHQAHAASAFYPSPFEVEIMNHARDRVRKWGGELYFVYVPEFSRYSGAVEDHDDYRKRQVVIDTVKALGISVVDLH